MRLVLFLIVLIYCAEYTAQVKYSLERHRIFVNDGGVFEYVEKEGIIFSDKGYTFSIPYVDIEKIEDVLLTYSNKKIKKVKQKDFVKTSLSTNSFYDGTQALQYNLTQPTNFKLSYVIKREDLMFLSTLSFSKWKKCDSIIYELTIPSTYYLSYNIPYEIEELVVDSVIIPNQKRYTFTLIDDDSKVLSELKFSNSSYIVSQSLYKSVRIQISQSKNPNKALNDWYLDLIENVGDLNQNAKDELDVVVKGLKDEDEIISTIFKYIQQKIRYLDIEDGISAFKPRDVNDILYKSQGDCKDMSNLLTQALVYKGFDARMALSSSLSHRFDLDFPNIASANHVVCVVNKNGSWILLDATDKYCKYLNPSSHVQGRSIFIMGKENGFYYKVKSIPYTSNLDSSYTDIEIDGENFQGTIKLNKKGAASKRYYVSKDYYKSVEFEDWLRRRLEREYDFFNIKELEHTIDSDSSIIELSIENSSNAISAIKNRKYLPIGNLLKYPHKYPKNIGENEKLITYETIYKKGVIRLNFKENIKLIKPIEASYSNNGLAYNFTAKVTGSKIIELNYLLIIDKVELKNDLIKSYNELNYLITEVMNKSIVYE